MQQLRLRIQCLIPLICLVFLNVIKNKLTTARKCNITDKSSKELLYNPKPQNDAISLKIFLK